MTEKNYDQASLTEWLEVLAMAQTHNQQNQNAQPAGSSPFRSPANGTNNQQNQVQQNNNNNNPPAPVPPPAPAPQQNNNRFNNRPGGLFGAQEKVSNPIQPLAKTVVRFELDGLGDPFYRLLGHELNPDYGDGKTIAQVLEQGSDAVCELEKMLEATWETYELKGAALVYRWNLTQWKALLTPYVLPMEENQQNNPPVQEDEEGDQAKNALKSPFTVIRAIDLQLVINVLARARTQVLLAKAPLIFNQGYLNRVLVTDDSRLVALARATGAIQEGFLA